MKFYDNYYMINIDRFLKKFNFTIPKKYIINQSWAKVIILEIFILLNKIYNSALDNFSKFIELMNKKQKRFDSIV